MAPKRYFNDITFDDQMEIIQHHIDNNENVVVLAPSSRAAQHWEKYGAKIIDKDNIETTISALKMSRGNFVVFVNRYDGIDLSGDSCNVLIIYDHPKFKYIKDEYYQNIHHLTSGSLIAQTIEQGMGRSVRSGSDYSVIYLMGRHILKFLRLKDNLEYFNKYTKKQLELGLNLMEGHKIEPDNVVDFIKGIADNCLEQKAGWQNYYSNYMNSEEDVDNVQVLQTQLLQVKSIEKDAIKLFINKQYEAALKKLQEIVQIVQTDAEKAWYLQLCANFIYAESKSNSNDFQIQAKQLSRKMLDPFLSTEKWKIKTNKNQLKRSLEFIESFSTTNDLLLFIKEEILQNFVYSEHVESKHFESSIYNLGRLLGFESSLPEKENNEGCDVLWICSEFVLILEAKSRKDLKNLISKSDVEQILHSLTWFDNKYIYSGERYGISLQNNRKKESNVSIPQNIHVMDSNNLEGLKISIIRFIAFLSTKPLEKIKEDDVSTEFHNLHFTEKMFLKKYVSNIT